MRAKATRRSTRWTRANSRSRPCRRCSMGGGASRNNRCSARLPCSDFASHRHDGLTQRRSFPKTLPFLRHSCGGAVVPVEFSPKYIAVLANGQSGACTLDHFGSELPREASAIISRYFNVEARRTGRCASLAKEDHYARFQRSHRTTAQFKSADEHSHPRYQHGAQGPVLRDL